MIAVVNLRRRVKGRVGVRGGRRCDVLEDLFLAWFSRQGWKCFQGKAESNFLEKESFDRKLLDSALRKKHSLKD